MAKTGRRRAAALLLALGCAARAGAQPANDDCADATVASSLPFVDSVDMTTATTEPADPVSACPGGQGTNSVWYRLPATGATALFRGEAGGTGSLYGVRAFTGSCGALTEIWCDSTFPTAPEFGVAPEGQEILVEVVNWGTAGTLAFALGETEEFLIHKGGQRTTSVAGGPDGFLVVWEAGPGQAQLFSPKGAPIGAAFDFGTTFVIEPHVASAGDGSFFVVWDGGTPQAARVDGPGIVVPLPAVSAFYPKVAADEDGNFIVVWAGSDGSGSGIKGQRFDRDGNALAAPFQVNTYTTGFQEYPSVAMAPSGEFVIAWQVSNDGDDEGIAARLYDPSGIPVTGEFAVNSQTTNAQHHPAVAMDPAGAFVVAWEGAYYYGPPTFEDTVRMRRFDAGGTPLAPDFVVNTEEYYISGHIGVAATAAGEFLVGWETYDTDMGASFVENAARRFGTDGTPTGPQFLVGTFGGYAHYDPSVGATLGGDFMIVWNDFRGFFTSEVGTGIEDAIVGRVFPAPGFQCAPAALPGCRTPTAPLTSKLLLQDESDNVDDQLRWKFVKGEATSVTDVGDPTADEDYVLCMYDATSPTGALLMENRIPAGGTCGTKPCWTALGDPPGSKGYRYKSQLRTPHGIQKMVVKPGPDGKSKIVIKGGQDNVFSASPGAPPLPLPLPVTVQLQNHGGACWQATYDVAGVGENEAGFYKGSGS